MPLLAIVLSLVAAMLFAVASVLQAAGTRGVPDDDAVGAGFFVTLAQRKTWVAGIVADIVGFVVQAWALTVGSLMLVQPLLVTTLLFALPLAAFSERRLLTVREWVWAGALIASLVVFMVLGRSTDGIEDPGFGRWIIPLCVMIPIVVVCVIGGARLPHGSLRSLTLAIAAGLLLGLSAPFTKTGIGAFDDGILAGLSAWEFWAMAVTATLGTLWQQSSYQAGDVQTSLPAVTVLRPIIAMSLGLTIYEESLQVRNAGGFMIVVALGVMLVSTIMLGRLGAPPDARAGNRSMSVPGA
ncbi:DMT family transporter [Gordonia sp. DT30]|uniref:DMT family transporter n=1 Tax=Gordonia sp. DT30 TaxID=3416546 RepID=UPI003CF0D1A3